MLTIRSELGHVTSNTFFLRLFCCERIMWTRFSPTYSRMISWLGDLVLDHLNFCNIMLKSVYSIYVFQSLILCCWQFKFRDNNLRQCWASIRFYCVIIPIIILCSQAWYSWNYWRLRTVNRIKDRRKSESTHLLIPTHILKISILKKDPHQWFFSFHFCVRLPL